MNKYRRIFLIVLDSLGIGSLPDADRRGPVNEMMRRSPRRIFFAVASGSTRLLEIGFE